MKPRVGIYLSEATAARLAEAAKRPGATKSALVEAALDRFLGSDDNVGDEATVGCHLAELSRQIEQLDRNLRIANETAALHARFHLAVTPILPAAAQGAACALGAQRFEEFAVQVGRRVDLGVCLVEETIERACAEKADALANDPGDDDPSGTGSVACEQDDRSSMPVDNAHVHIAAVREDGRTADFPERTGSALH